MRDNKGIEKLELKISQYLRRGVALCFIILFFYFLGSSFLLEQKSHFSLLTRGASPLERILENKDFSLQNINDLMFLLSSLGLFFLILLPFFRVAFTSFYFLKNKEKIFFLLSLFVLIIMLMSMTLGLL